MSLYSPTDSEQSVLDTFAGLEPGGISYLDWQHGPHSPRAKSPVIGLFPSESLSEKRQHVGRFRARIDANSIPREVYSHGNFCLYHFETLCLTIEAYRAKFKDIVPHLLKLTRHPGFTLTELYNSSLHPVEVAEKFSRIGDYEQIPREIYFSTIRQVVTLAFSDVFKDRQREEGVVPFQTGGFSRFDVILPEDGELSGIVEGKKTMLHPLDGKYMAQYEALVTNWSADVIEMAVEKGVLPSFVTALRVRETPDEAYESSEIHKPFLHPKEWWSLDDLTETMINAHGVPDGSVSTWRDALVTEISRGLLQIGIMPNDFRKNIMCNKAFIGHVIEHIQHTGLNQLDMLQLPREAKVCVNMDPDLWDLNIDVMRIFLGQG